MIDDEKESTIKHLSWSAQSFIEQPPSYLLHKIIFIFTTCLILFFFLSIFLKVDRTVTAIGSINAESGVKHIVSTIEGVVETSDLKMDMLVKKNQVVTRLKINGSTESELIDFSKKIKENINLIKVSKSASILSENFLKKIHDSKLRAHFIDVEKKQKSYFFLKNEGLLFSQKETEPLSKRKNILNQQHKKINSSEQKNYMLSHIYAIEDEIGRISVQISSIENNYNSRVNEALIELEKSIELALSELDIYIQQHQIKAPVSGRIAQVSRTPGSAISANTTIASIVNDQSPMIAEVFVSSEDVPRVKIDAKVFISVDSYPRSKYGYFSGKIISLEKIKSNQLLNPSKSAEVTYGYLAKVRIDASQKRFFNSHQLNYNFVPGMSVEALIVWKRASILQIMKSYILGDSV